MDKFFEQLTFNIKNHDRVIIMTHAIPDLDGMGSAIAFTQILKKMDKECIVVAPKKMINKSLNKAINYLNDESFVIPFQYEKNIEIGNDLLIILDTDEKCCVECKELLDIKDKVVIDHHTRGSNVIDNTICEYLDDKKSSVIEIMVEYLKYLNYGVSKEVATIMFTGLFIDTNGFNLKTTPRTFEVAAYLLSEGADLYKNQSFLKSSMDEVLKRYRYVENCDKLDENVYLSVVDNHFTTNVELALLANEMMKIENVHVAFTVGLENEGTVLVSARSVGDTDVSKMMMKLGGGGHFSAAAAKIHDSSIPEVISKLKDIIKER